MMCLKLYPPSAYRSWLDLPASSSPGAREICRQPPSHTPNQVDLAAGCHPEHRPGSGSPEKGRPDNRLEATSPANRETWRLLRDLQIYANLSESRATLSWLFRSGLGARTGGGMGVHPFLHSRGLSSSKARQAVSAECGTQEVWRGFIVIGFAARLLPPVCGPPGELRTRSLPALGFAVGGLFF